MLWAPLCITANSGCQCPLWVKSGHRSTSTQCPLYPRKRTLELSRVMSALCQKQTSGQLLDMIECLWKGAQALDVALMAVPQIRFDDGLSYERYMGDWSRRVGSVFLDLRASGPPRVRQSSILGTQWHSRSREVRLM